MGGKKSKYFDCASYVSLRIFHKVQNQDLSFFIQNKVDAYLETLYFKVLLNSSDIYLNPSAKGIRDLNLAAHVLISPASAASVYF